MGKTTTTDAGGSWTQMTDPETKAEFWYVKPALMIHVVLVVVVVLVVLLPVPTKR